MCQEGGINGLLLMLLLLMLLRTPALREGKKRMEGERARAAAAFIFRSKAGERASAGGRICEGHAWAGQRARARETDGAAAAQG